MDGFIGLNNPVVLILVLGTFIWSMVAQAQVKSAYKKFTKVRTYKGQTGAEAARNILDRNGLSHVRIERAQGTLSDHFDPKTNVVRLSQGVHDGNTVASVSIAAHEVGHAIQHAENYSFISIRNFLLPAAVVSSKYVSFLFFIGIILGGMHNMAIGGLLMDVAIVMFMATVLFQAVTLPLEFDASKRAKLQLVELNMIDAQELDGVKRMLSAAAMTYVAALSVAIAQLIRMVALRNRD